MSKHSLRVQGVSCSQISKHVTHESGKVVSLTHRPHLWQEMYLVLIYVSDWLKRRAIVQSGGLCQ